METPLNPDTLYGRCKKQTYETLRELQSALSDYAAFSWVRLFNIYGSHEYHERLIPTIFSSFLQGRVPKLNSPAAVRDYIFVDNVAEILVKLLDGTTTQAINIGSGISLSIAELAKIIHARFFDHVALPPGAPVESVPKEDKLLPGLEQLRKLNIQFATSFNESLDKTYEWWAGQVS